MNVVSIRQKVQQAISKAPLTLTIYRTNLVDDGCGGYKVPRGEEKLLVGTVDGILDNSATQQIKSANSTGGRLAKVDAGKFITPWAEGITFRRGDYFELNGETYMVDNAVNVLSMNIYWQLDLTKELKGAR